MKKLLLFIAFITSLFIVPSTSLASLNPMKDLVREEYYGELPANWEEAATIEELVTLLDPYSSYMTAEEFEQFSNLIESQTVGIGIVIASHEQGLYVVHVIKGTNAQLAGIEAGDIITHADGQLLKGLSPEMSALKLQGENGTTLQLILLKPNKQIVQKTVLRQEFEIPNATSELLAYNVGYIALSSFSQNAAYLLREQYAALRKQGATSFIIDLQYNTGGYVNAAQQVIGLFPNAPHAYIKKTAQGQQLILGVTQTTQFPKNTRLLINNYSASASEMVAAAVKDQQSALLYGQRTYGKGVMQAAYVLPDGSYFRLTVAEFLSPYGTKIQHTGVTPHIVTNGEPLYDAHFDAMAEQLEQYEQLAELKDVTTTKTFTITFNDAVEAAVAKNAVELVQLGTAQSVPLSLQVHGNTLKVTPTQKLIPGAQYALIVHPTIKSAASRALHGGYYVKVTVQQ